MNDAHDAVDPQGEWQPTQPEGPPRRLPLRFTGSGSEYFRIWIVNLLLTLLTLGLYYPWAKVRKLRYFHGNTLVGDHPFGFHADPRKMLRGYLLVTLLLVLYSVAGHFSPTAGFLAFVIVAAVWPALLKSSMQFRLANTSWRGLRFRFRGTLKGAYAAWLPFFVPGIVLLAALAAVPDPEDPPVWFGLIWFGVIAIFFAVAPWWWWRLKKYQHDHYAYASEQTRLNAGVGSFYGVWARTGGIGAAAMLAVTVVAIVGAVVLGVAAGLGGGGRRGGGAVGAAAVIGVIAIFVGLLAAQLLPRPYFTSRMQNLLWSSTASRAVGFESALRFWPLFGLTLKNWLLIVLTLGLYWPFAAVAMQRMKLEAITLLLSVDPQRLIDSAARNPSEAAGDAAGDLFGMDFGL